MDADEAGPDRGARARRKRLRLYGRDRPSAGYRRGACPNRESAVTAIQSCWECGGVQGLDGRGGSTRHGPCCLRSAGAQAGERGLGLSGPIARTFSSRRRLSRVPVRCLSWRNFSSFGSPFSTSPLLPQVRAWAAPSSRRQPIKEAADQRGEGAGSGAAPGQAGASVVGAGWRVPCWTRTRMGLSRTTSWSRCRRGRRAGPVHLPCVSGPGVGAARTRRPGRLSRSLRTARACRACVPGRSSAGLVPLRRAGALVRRARPASPPRQGRRAPQGLPSPGRPIWSGRPVRQPRGRRRTRAGPVARAGPVTYPRPSAPTKSMAASMPSGANHATRSSSPGPWVTDSAPSLRTKSWLRAAAAPITRAPSATAIWTRASRLRPRPRVPGRPHRREHPCVWWTDKR